MLTLPALTADEDTVDAGTTTPWRRFTASPPPTFHSLCHLSSGLCACRHGLGHPPSPPVLWYMVATREPWTTAGRHTGLHRAHSFTVSRRGAADVSGWHSGWAWLGQRRWAGGQTPGPPSSWSWRRWATRWFSSSRCAYCSFAGIPGCCAPPSTRRAAAHALCSAINGSPNRTAPLYHYALYNGMVTCAPPGKSTDDGGTHAPVDGQHHARRRTCLSAQADHGVQIDNADIRAATYGRAGGAGKHRQGRLIASRARLGVARAAAPLNKTSELQPTSFATHHTSRAAAACCFLLRAC